MFGLTTTSPLHKDIARTTTTQSTTTRFNRDSSVLPPRKIELDLTVRVLSENYICVVVDPTSFFRERRKAHCGAFMGAKEEVSVPDWQYEFFSFMGWAETQYHYLPQMISSMREKEHWRVGADLPTNYCMWPMVLHNHWDDPATDWTDLYEGTRNADHADHLRTGSACDIAMYCYIQMPSAMTNGTEYDIVDAWGNHVVFTYHEDTSTSWGIKVNQVGYITSAKKYGYLGIWMGPELGGLDFSGYSGNSFYLKKESDDSTVYTGTITYRMDDPEELYTGESTTDPDAARAGVIGEYKQYELDFSSYTTVGEYYIQIDGIGRSWPFLIDTAANVYGPLYYHASRALFHQRGGQTFTSTYSECPHDSNYHEYYNNGEDKIRFFKADNAPSGEPSTGDGTYGWYDVTDDLWYDNWTISKFGDGDKLQMSYIQAALAGQDPVNDVTWSTTIGGGFQDAADQDRRQSHLACTTMQSIAYLMYPTYFSDNQLNIPESGDGMPDILSNAEWGIEWIKDIQTLIGTGAAITTAEQSLDRRDEGDRHKFFTGSPTRVSSFAYAYAAAIFGKALLVAGETTLGNTYITSAEDAYSWAKAQGQIVLGNCTWNGHTVKYYGPNTTDDEYKRAYLWAAIGLRIATEDASYLTDLNGIGDTYFESHLDELSTENQSAGSAQPNYGNEYFKHTADIALISMYSSLMPTGWATYAEGKITIICNKWASFPTDCMYRQVWKPEGKEWNGSSWVNRGTYIGDWQAVNWEFRTSGCMAHLLAGYKVLGTASYLENALYGMDYFFGCNPRGRTQMSGIGKSSLYVWLLNFPVKVQNRGEYPRGYEIYNENMSISGYMALFAPNNAKNNLSNCYAINKSADRDGYRTDARVFLPKPYHTTTVFDYDDIRTKLGYMIPRCRRMYTNERAEIAMNEFTVWEQQATMIFCCACLMGSGWLPDNDLKTWARRTESEMFDSRFFMP